MTRRWVGKLVTEYNEGLRRGNLLSPCDAAGAYDDHLLIWYLIGLVSCWGENMDCVSMRCRSSS